MSRHRPFKSQIKKSPVGEFEIKKVIREASVGPGKRLGDIPFSDLMLNYATLSGDFEAVSANFAAISGIVADGFGALSAEIDKRASIADATLTDVYSDNPTFTTWVVEPAVTSDNFEVSVKRQENSKWCLAIVEESLCGMGKGDASSLSLSWQNGTEAEYGIVATRETTDSPWTIVVDDPNADVFLKLSSSQWIPYKKNLIPVGDAKGDTMSTTLTWTDEECQIHPTPFVATRTRTGVVGYTLGSQTAKPLQKKLTFDSTPTAGSGNPVTSDGIRTAIEVAAVNVVSLEWSELKTLRDSGTLVPGCQYRITDYVATVANDSNARSANHPFDLIVVADSESKINEKARAIRHAGDTYFPASVKFEAWQVWYCLDNDTNRFAWADATNGKGVIYRLIDEWRNDCPYDFKGIQFARWELSNPVGYIFDADTYEWVEDTGGKLASFLNVKSGLYGLSDSDNVLSFGYDESISEDLFKIEYTVSENPTYLFTFGSSDFSVSGTTIYGNVIRPIFAYNKLTLNNIVFQNSVNSRCFSNTFEYGCSSNTFGYGCNANTFGYNFTSNTFGDGCKANTFGYNFTSNAFGDSCSYNTFGDECYSNTFGDSCASNTFGDECYSNTFGDSCASNAFGDSCSANIFGDECTSNTFGDSCFSDTFGESCAYNTFGDGCISNTFGESCAYNTFGDGCFGNTFGDDPESPQSYFQFVTFESGVNSVTLYCSVSRSDSDYCQNITVAKGVTGALVVSDANQASKTTYQATGSQTINV